MPDFVRTGLRDGTPLRLRVLPRGFVRGSDDQGEWISPHGTRRYDVPGGYVELEFSDQSASGIAYCNLTYQPLRAGLMRFKRV